MSGYPVGKGVLIWKLSRIAGGGGLDALPEPQAIVEQAAKLRLSWVGIKFQDGEYIYPTWRDSQKTEAFRTFQHRVVASLKQAGIAVWGWGYVYGANRWRQSMAKGEAQAVVEAVRTFDLAGWLIDAESQYKRAGASKWARQFMLTLRDALPTLPLGLCSYRYPTVHPELPWTEFLQHCDFHAPQVYWMGASNPGEQLQRSVRELRELHDLPVVPIGAAFAESGWQPTAAQIDEFHKTVRMLELPGEGWWEWYDIEQHPDWFEAIRAHRWPSVPEVHDALHDAQLALIEARKKMDEALTHIEEAIAQREHWGCYG